jgi:hypothetical protein
VIFAFVFDSQEAAQAAESRLTTAGYRVQLQPQEDGAAVLAVSQPEDDAAPEVVQARLQLMVEPLGGESLGYGGVTSYGFG